MSLTAHLDRMPRRSAENAAATPELAGPMTAGAARLPSVINRVLRGAVALAGMSLVLVAITAFNVWVWWPRR